jgi:hypothetical protein
MNIKVSALKNIISIKNRLAEIILDVHTAREKPGKVPLRV